MTLHNGPVPRKELTPSEQALATALAGGDGELGFLVIDKSGEHGYLVVANDLPDHKYFAAKLLKQAKEYLNNGKYIEFPLDHEPDGAGGKCIHLRYIGIGQADIARLMPLFGEDGKERIYRTVMNGKSKLNVVEPVDRKAIAVEWRNFRENRDKDANTHQTAQLARAVTGTDNCLTVLVIDKEHNMELVHYTRRDSANKGFIVQLSDWLKANGWLESTLVPRKKPAHLMLEKKAGQSTGLLTLDKYDRLIVPIEHPVAQERLKQIFVDNKMEDHILHLPTLTSEIPPDKQEQLSTRVRNTSRGVA